ncbi:MAG: hypothetical protein IH984_09425 [Planctomycetes bacterium]|nr:hypothetical protein [Planctomycetota bacterium]
MQITNQWQELCRFTDQTLARAVATSIAAMEFDVRLIEIGNLNQRQYVIEVDCEHFDALNEILQEIVDEQIEFDELLEFNCTTRSRQRIIIIIALTGVVEVIAILGLIEL